MEIKSASAHAMPRALVFDISSYAFFSLLSILLASVFISGYELVYFSAMALSVLLLLSYASISLSKRKNLRDQTRYSLQILHRMKSSMLLSGSFASCIPSYDKRGAQNALESAFAKLHMRMKFGQDFGDAALYLGKEGKQEISVLGPLSVSYRENMDMYLALKHVYDSMFKERIERIEHSYASLQKYSSISMVSGTILPSFFLFGFIGYALMQASAAFLLAFAVAFLLVLPALFSLVRIFQADNYEI
ncbi:MAG: hypothetical protein ACP5NE_02690 [Candidatus Micrarchaeia archaeon]